MQMRCCYQHLCCVRSARFFNFYLSCFTYTWYNQSFRFTRHFYHHINSNRIPLNLPNILSKLKLQTHVGLAPAVFESDMKRNIKFLETTLSQPMYFFFIIFPEKEKRKITQIKKSITANIFLFCFVQFSWGLRDKINVYIFLFQLHIHVPIWKIS